MFNNVITSGIVVLIVVLVFVIIKTIFQNIFLNKIANKSYAQLREKIAQEQLKLQINNERILLVEELHITIFNRVFKIARDIILVQKLIFDK
ncbi:hypothetical protein [Mariniflexile sp.]|uniref:hypothetical protein n=1 Tax=Mariniflexile sp. TaxID=1979402 RepID=UPI003565847D